MIAVYLLITNLVTAVLFYFGIKHTRSGTRHASIENPDERVAYIWKVFQDYFHVSGQQLNDVRGKTILEIGPGDSFGVALLFLCHGADRVICIDKFYSLRNSLQHRIIYKKLRESLDDSMKVIFDAVANVSAEDVKFDEQKLTVIFGKDIKDARKYMETSSVDWIVSRAVLEHISRPDLVLHALDYLVSKNGLLIHKIDFRDHGLFSARGLHPLTFMIFSDSLYALMSSASGRPNRALWRDYSECLDSRRYESHFYVTHYLGSREDVTEKKLSVSNKIILNEDCKNLMSMIRDRLNSRFNAKSDEELMITGTFFVAKKIS